MTRAAFILVIAIILVLAFGLGWFAHWLVHRFTRVAGGDMGEIDQLAQDLHMAEELRDQALSYAQTREEESQSQLAQAEAELRAAMEGLREARAEAEDLRAYIATLNARG